MDTARTRLGFVLVRGIRDVSVRLPRKRHPVSVACCTMFAPCLVSSFRPPNLSLERSAKRLCPSTAAAAPDPARHPFPMLSPVVLHRPYGGSGSSCQPATFATAVPTDSWLELEVATCADTYVPKPPYRLRVPDVLRAVRTRGLPRVGLHCTYAARVPAAGVPYVPHTVAPHRSPPQTSYAASCSPAQTKSSSGGCARTLRSM